MDDSTWTSAFHMVVDAALSCAKMIFSVTGAAVHYFAFVAIFSALFVGVIRRFLSNTSWNYGTQIHFQAKRGVEKYKNKIKGD